MRTSRFDPEVEKTKMNNKKAFEETTAMIKAGYYTAPSGKRVDLDMEPMIVGGRCYHKELTPIDMPMVKGGTTVLVEQGDCLKVAERLVNGGYNPALLNFASAGHPGGGVEGGARAQEETICRRSTLTRSIFSFDAFYALRYGYTHRDGNNYPLTRSLDFSMVYSPDVTVFREAGPDYTPMEHPFKVGVITNAALNLNGRFPIRLTQDGRMPEEAKAITRNKIRSILRVGLIKGHDSLVLGAFGCGAFHNPPLEMAQLFKEVMAEEEFVNRYRLITFAILSDHNDKSGNFEAFKQVFDKNISNDDSMVHTTEPSKERIQRAMKNALSNFGFEMEALEDQKYQIIRLLKQTGRENIDKVVEWMEENGFFESFASISHHNAFYGGLATHSFEVYKEAIKLNAELEEPLPEDSVVLCALLHDLCKAGLYYYDEEARSRKKRPEIAAQGHGIRSVNILKSCGLPLSREEELAIWWHMGEHEEPFDHPEIYEATKSIPLCNLIRKADHEAAVKKEILPK